jgi:hypothetical protein
VAAAKTLAVANPPAAIAVFTAVLVKSMLIPSVSKHYPPLGRLAAPSPHSLLLAASNTAIP